MKEESPYKPEIASNPLNKREFCFLSTIIYATNLIPKSNDAFLHNSLQLQRAKLNNLGGIDRACAGF